MASLSPSELTLCPLITIWHQITWWKLIPPTVYHLIAQDMTYPDVDWSPIRSYRIHLEAQKIFNLSKTKIQKSYIWKLQLRITGHYHATETIKCETKKTIRKKFNISYAYITCMGWWILCNVIDKSHLWGRFKLILKLFSMGGFHGNRAFHGPV